MTLFLTIFYKFTFSKYTSFSSFYSHLWPKKRIIFSKNSQNLSIHSFHKYATFVVWEERSSRSAITDVHINAARTMNRIVISLLISAFFILSAATPLLAQPSLCADFNTLTPSAQPILPNSVVYEDGVSRVTALDVSVTELFAGQTVIRSSSLLIEPSTPSTAFTQAFLSVYLFKNGQQISVNGAPGHEITLADTVPVQIAPGITLQLLSVPVNGTIGEVAMLLSGTIERIAIFPEEFLMMGLCVNVAPVQTDQCLSLDGLAPPLAFGSGSGTPPGSIFYTEDQVHLSVEPFFPSSGDSLFGTLSVIAGGPLNLPVSFLAEQISLGIDLTDLPEPAGRVSVLLQQDGGEVSVEVNGVATILKMDSLVNQGAPFVITDQAVATITLGPAGIASSVILTLTGSIDQLVVGGSALAIGQICYETGPAQVDFCLPLENGPADIYEFDNGFAPGDSVAAFTGVSLRFTEPSNPTLSSFIEITSAAGGTPPFPFSDTYLHLFNGAELDFTGVSLSVQEVRFDYQTDQNDTLRVNGFAVLLPQALNNTTLTVNGIELSGVWDPATQVGSVVISGAELSRCAFDHAGISIGNICLTATGGSPGSSGCLSWEDAASGTLFGDPAGDLPGDTIYTEDFITVTLKAFLDVGGDTLFGNGVIEEAPFSNSGSQNRAFFSHLNLVFDFSAYGQVDQLTFAFTQGNPGVNLGINGQSPVYYELLEDANGPLAPGIVFSYDAGTGIGSITGPVTSLTIGGIESTIDDICAVAAPCQITSLTADDLTCPGVDGLYRIDLFLSWQNNPAQLFEVYADTLLLGVFEAGQFPLNDLAFPGQADSVVLRVCGVGQPDCCEEAIVDLTPCQICELESSVIVGDCQSDGSFFIEVEADGQFGSDSFAVSVNDISFGTYDYSGGSVSVGPLSGDAQTIYQVVATDADNSLCADTVNIGPVDCLPCVLDSLTIDSVVCLGSSFWQLTIDFNPMNAPGVGFDLFIDGQFYAFIEYSALPVVLDSVVLTDTMVTISACDQTDTTCCANPVTTSLPFCPVPCELEVEHVQTNCLNADSLEAVITMGVLGDIDSIVFWVDSTLAFSASVDPDSMQVTVVSPPLPDGGIALDVRGYVSGQLNCETALVIDEECVPDCDLSIAGESIFCETNGVGAELMVAVSGDIDSLQLWLDNQLIGGFPVVSDTVTIITGLFDPAPLQFYLAGLYDGELACFLPLLIEPPCDYFTADVTQVTCLADGAFDLELDIEADYLTSDSLDVSVGGVNVGLFDAGSFPLLIDSLNGYIAGDTVEVSVCGVGLPCELTTFVVPNCPSGDCSIKEFEATAFCDGNAAFIEFSFLSDNTSDSFSVISCMPLGTFAYGQGSYLIEVDVDSLMCANPDAVPFGVFDQDEPGSCNALTVLSIPDCDQQCSITELEAIPTDCEDGEFSFDISFEAENTGSNFLVFVNGVFSGFFAYADLPVQVGPYEGDGGTTYDIEVVDAQDPTCSASMLVDPVTCTPCQLSGLNAVVSCIGGVYYVAFSFDAANTSDSFIVQTCLPQAVLAYGQNSYLIEIPESEILCAGGQVFPFGVYDAEHPGTCWDATLLSVPVCPPVCQFEELEVEVTACDAGQFTATLSFEPDLADSSGFLVFANDILFGPFDYGQDTYDVGPLAADDTTAWDFLLIDLADPFCFGYISLNPVSCDTCGLLSVATAMTCNGSSGLTNVAMNLTHSGSDSLVEVRLDGDLIEVITLPDVAGTDTFSFSPLLLTGTGRVLSVCSVGIPDCCLADTLMSIQCDLVDCLELEMWQDSVFSAPEEQPGDTLLTESGVTISFSPGTQMVYALIAEDTAFHLASGLVLQTESDLDFDFTALPGDVVNMQFLFSGDTLRFQPEGQPLLVVSVATINGDTVLSLGGGHTLYISRDALHADEATIHISGAMEGLMLGTTAGAFADICLDYDDDVWPGDADFDNMARHTDVLAIGLAYGAQGPARDTINIDWDGKPAADWPQAFSGGTNYKHADCNGDGFVDSTDVEAVSANYGLTHGTPAVLPPHPGAPSDPPLYFDWPDWSTLSPGQQVVIPLNLGLADNPVNDLYGLAFELDVDTSRFSNFQFEFQPNWLADLSGEGVSISLTTGGSSIAAALTRTDQQNSSGSGTLGYFIGIIDDLAGMSAPPVDIQIDAAHNVNETLVPLYSPNTLLQVSGPPWWKKYIVVAPNPGMGVFRVFNNSRVSATELTILDARGEIIYSTPDPGPVHEVDGGTWRQGLYFLHLRFPDGSRHAEPVLIVRP